MQNITFNFNPRNIVTKTTAYTALLTDDLINVTGTTTITLPALSTLGSNMRGNKAYKIANTGTAVVTIAAATGETINGASSMTLGAGDSIVFNGSIFGNWVLSDPEEKLRGRNMSEALATQVTVATVGTATTANNIFTGSTAPVALAITGVVVVSHDTFANSITIQNGTTTVTTITKSTTVGTPVGGIVANGAVVSGATFTVTGNATGTCSVFVTYKAQ